MPTHRQLPDPPGATCYATLVAGARIVVPHEPIADGRVCARCGRPLRARP